ncbi:MAG: response regulator transcription factor [Ignavibacteria bacterium]|nr:response regulator transcription factor [Ignavibacteria bacterium]
MRKRLETHRILLIEDEKKLSAVVARHLTGEGFAVESSPDGEGLMKRLAGSSFSLIILDLNLPRKSGFQLLLELRAEYATLPVLILSARDGVPDKVRGLLLGADDYLTKPFDLSELSARMQAILRRAHPAPQTTLSAGDLTMDLLNQKVRRGSADVTLSRKEYALLEFFLRNKNQILTRKRIAEQVWGYTFDTGTNIVDVYVSYLRKAIDDGASQKLIQTVFGQGYMLADDGDRK